MSGELPRVGLVPLEKNIKENNHSLSTLQGHIKKVAVCKSGKETSPETELASPLTMDVQPPEP